MSAADLYEGRQRPVLFESYLLVNLQLLFR